MALQISTGAGKHACIEGATALGGLEAHVGDLGAISTRILESRSRRDRLRASRPPKAVATYLSVRSGSWTYDLRPGNHAGPPGEAQTAPGRALTLWPLWGRGPGRRIWRVRGRATFGPPRADQDTSWRSSYLLEPERTLTGRWLRP